MIRIQKICVTPAVGVRSTVTMPRTAPVHPWDWPKSMHKDFAGPNSNGKSSIHQNVSKFPVVSNKTPVPNAVTKVPTSIELRYPQREKKLDL